MKILRWLFWLLLLGGLVVFLLAVPIDGRTCLERIHGTEPSAKRASTTQAATVAPKEKKAAKDADQLTEEDRQALTKLIGEELGRVPENEKPD